MFNPTTGSPTITLFQLRSNRHIVFNDQKYYNCKNQHMLQILTTVITVLVK